MIDIKLAKELKKAGLVWSPKMGDWFATVLSPLWWLKGKKTGEEEIYLLTGQPTETGYFGWSMSDTEPFCELFTHDGQKQEESWEHLDKNFLWLPRLDQLAAELSLHVKSFKLVFENISTESSEITGYWVSYVTEGPEKKERLSPEVFYSPVTEESLGRALLAVLMSKHQQQ